MILRQPTRYGSGPSTFLLVRHPQPPYSSHLCGFALTRAANIGMHSTPCQFFTARPPNTRSKTIDFLVMLSCAAAKSP